MVGFKNGKIQLMTYENISGITAGSFVRNTGSRLQIPVGDFLKGRIINALGHPIDGKGEFPPGKLYTVDSAISTLLTVLLSGNIWNLGLRPLMV